MASRLRRATASSDSGSRRSSGAIVNTRSPFFTMLPSRPTIRFASTGARIGSRDLVEHLHDFDHEQRLAGVEVLALLDQRRQVRRLACVEGAAHGRDDLVERRAAREHACSSAARVSSAKRSGNTIERSSSTRMSRKAVRAPARGISSSRTRARAGSRGGPRRSATTARRRRWRARRGACPRRAATARRSRALRCAPRPSRRTPGPRRGSPRRAPRLLGGRLVRARLEVEEVVEAVEHSHRIRHEADLRALGPPELPVVAPEEAAEQVRVREQARERPQQQRLLRLERRARVLVPGAAEELLERELEVQVARHLRERPDRAEVRRHEARVRLGHDSAPRNHWISP